MRPPGKVSAGRPFRQGETEMSRPLFSLGERLALCASMVRPGAKLADVGTDHAYLPVWLARRGLIRSAVAADVRPGPLERAKKNIEKYGAGGKVTARLSDGLDGVRPEEAEDIVIAGMGGLLMADIAARTPWLREPGRRLILQPMTSEDDLRRTLSGLGFAVLEERCAVEAGHVYCVMLCAYDPPHRMTGKIFPYTGRIQPDTPENRLYLRRKMQSLKKQEKGAALCGRGEEAEEIESIRAEIEKMLQKERILRRRKRI